jgi:hypothetical protein
MERRQPHRLLQLRVTVDLDVRGLPELVQVRALLGHQPVPAGVARSRERRPDLVVQRRQRPPRRPAVGQVLDNAQGGAGFETRDHRGAGDVVTRLRADLVRAGPVDLVVHRRGDVQAGSPGAVDQERAGVGDAVLLRDQRVGQRGLDPRIGVIAGRQLLVGHQLRLHHQQRGGVEHLHLVLDRGHGPLGQRHQPRRTHPHHPARRGLPLHIPRQRARLQVQHPLVPAAPPVPQIERLVLHQQPDQLAVGDVDDRLTRLRIPVPTLRVRQRAPLVERVQIRPRNRMRLPLVEVAPQPDVPVRQREHRLDLTHPVQIQPRLPHHPRFDREDTTG